MLTDKQVKAAKPKEKPYRLADRNGLSLFVTAAGHKSWRYKYRFGGKEKLIVFGSYPEMSLAEARDALDSARKQKRGGIDPRLAKLKTGLIGGDHTEVTFENVSRKWYAKQMTRWKPVHAHDVISSMERDLFPHIGSMPLGMIDKPLLLSVLEKVEKREAFETAHRLKQRVNAVFRFAQASGTKVENPAIAIGDAMTRVPPSRRWPALVDIKLIRQLLHDTDSAGASPITRLGARFLALTSQRPGMVRRAEWSEFIGIDWDNPDGLNDAAEWVTPSEKMKLELDQRLDDSFEHRVPLVQAAVDTIRSVRRLTGDCRYVFCNARSGQLPMSENAISFLYKRLEYKGIHVPHGWRSSFSTIMNETAEHASSDDSRRLADRLIIDLMLAHTPHGLSSAELRYNRARFMGRRRELATEWANLIMVDAMQPDEIIFSARRKPRN